MTQPTATAAPSTADLKAQLQARRDADKKVVTKLARAALKDLPEHTFQTGSKGRAFQGNLEVDGEPVMVKIQIVRRSTVVKADK